YSAYSKQTAKGRLPIGKGV
ncbi:protein TolA, partial [Vibrio harveyi]